LERNQATSSRRVQLISNVLPTRYLLFVRIFGEFFAGASRIAERGKIGLDPICSGAQLKVWEMFNAF
jgi:hypothetical protein